MSSITANFALSNTYAKHKRHFNHIRFQQGQSQLQQLHLYIGIFQINQILLQIFKIKKNQTE